MALAISRLVVDYNVDRPGVEVWQHMELTGTNKPCGLAIFFSIKFALSVPFWQTNFYSVIMVF